MYTRWGRTVCPHGATRVMFGIAGGAGYDQKGGGANLLCLPYSPKYLGYNLHHRGGTCISPVEYETSQGPLNRHLHQHNVPCAVCEISRSKLYMFPALTTCPHGWTIEYNGYLMATHSHHPRGEYVCIDRYATAIHGSGHHTHNAHDLYFVEPKCNGVFPCPPYNHKKELACVVCSKR